MTQQIVELWSNGRQLNIAGCSQSFLEGVAVWARTRPYLDLLIVRETR